MFPLVTLIFLKRSLVFPILLFSSISLYWSLRKTFLSLLAIFWNSAFKWVYLSFSHLLFASLLFTGICKASSVSHFAFCISLFGSSSSGDEFPLFLFVWERHYLFLWKDYCLWVNYSSLKYFFLSVLWIYHTLSPGLWDFAEKFADSIMGVLLYMASIFSIATFKILFVLDFDNLIIISLRVICFGLILFGVIWALLVSLSIFPPKIWEVSAIFSLNILFLFLSLLSLKLP